MILSALVSHCIFFVLALALVGFETMLVDLLLASFAYSVYLTLNECSIFIYIFFLMSGTFIGLFYSLSGKT